MNVHMPKQLRGGSKVDCINTEMFVKLDDEVLSILAEQHWPRLIVRGLYRYEHAGFKGVFVPGAPVTLEREPGNTYDPNAVRVILSNGEMLGYIAKENAPLISSELAEGVKFATRIADTAFSEKMWGQCELDVSRKVSPKNFEKLEMISRLNPNMSMWYDHYANVTHARVGKSPLCDAVARNDVVLAHEVLTQGADINEMTFCISGPGSHPTTFCSQPLLSKIRSLEMYKLFVEAGALLCPKSFIWDHNRGSSIKIYGKEHNLLEILWQGPKMDDAAVELADYLVFTEYDMQLRNRINEIRASCERANENCPYENNKEYVLEWCDMEKRAIVTAIDAVKEIAQSKGYYPHSASWELCDFIGDWKKYGYEQALRNGEFSKEDSPARYVYPDRILKRGFFHGDS